jgi:type IV pilus assembly protein PilQ
LLGADSLWLYADKAPIEEIIKDISTRTGNSYIMASIPKGDLSLQLNGAKYQDILRSVLSGSDCVFKKRNKIYIIGNKNIPDLMNQRIIQLQYRAVDSVQFLLPKDLIQETEIRVFREQNSLMLSGPEEKIVNAERFIQQIDRLVPVISIEVLIIDYNTTYNVTSGIEAGIGTSEAAPTYGEVFPSVDINLNSQSINDLISRFNGFGWAKIGKVTPRFYASLKAMETQGILNVRSTPILSTLNGRQK